MQAAAHCEDALAHRGDVGFPRRAQCGLGQDLRDDQAGVDRRARIVAPHRGLELAEYELGLGRVGADDAQRARALAVQAHAFGERVGDEENDAGAGECAHRECVFDDARAVALIREVEVRQQLAFAQHGNQLLPLRGRQVDAGRVVAASVQQHDALGGQAAQRGEHRVELQAAGGGVVVRIGVDLEAGAFEHRAMVVPGRIADPDFACRQPALQEVRADLQPAARAHGLQRCDAVALQRFVIRAEQQPLHFTPTRRRALDRQIGLGRAFGKQLRFGLAHAVEHRDVPHVVEVDPDRQVDLVRPRVVAIGLVERQDRIAGVGVEVLEHGASWLVVLKPPTRPRCLSSSTPACRSARSV